MHSDRDPSEKAVIFTSLAISLGLQSCHHHSKIPRSFCKRGLGFDRMHFDDPRRIFFNPLLEESRNFRLLPIPPGKNLTGEFQQGLISCSPSSQAAEVQSFVQSSWCSSKTERSCLRQMPCGRISEHHMNIMKNLQCLRRYSVMKRVVFESLQDFGFDTRSEDGP